MIQGAFKTFCSLTINCNARIANYSARNANYNLFLTMFFNIVNTEFNAFVALFCQTVYAVKIKHVCSSSRFSSIALSDSDIEADDSHWGSAHDCMLSDSFCAHCINIPSHCYLLLCVVVNYNDVIYTVIPCTFSWYIDGEKNFSLIYPVSELFELVSYYLSMQHYVTVL